MRQNAVGFYWTLPMSGDPLLRNTVRKLNDDVDEAAKESRTIRYQRDFVRTYAKEEGYELIREDVFLEVHPDRGTENITIPLTILGEYAKNHSARILYVDFSAAGLWRSHDPMRRWFEANDVQNVAVPAVPMMIDGREFDPHFHFRRWRQRQQEWTAAKPQRSDQAARRAKELREDGKSYLAVAQILNSEGARSLSGTGWTAESLRKFLKAKVGLDKA